MIHARLILTLLAVTAALCLAPAVRSARAAEEPLTVLLSINGKTLTAELDDNSAARDFFAMLPLSLPLEDFNSTEKISDLPRRLDASQAPDSCDPSAGDLTWYAPWGNLAIFYRDFSRSRGLVPLGRITSDIAPIAGAKNGDVLTITRANEQ